MTHLNIYSRLAKVGTKQTYAMLGYLAGTIIVLFIAVALVPQSWLTVLTEDNGAHFLAMNLEDNTRLLLVPFFLISPFLVINLVTGIVTAAEARAYLGAGVTRTAYWLDSRRTNIGISGILVISIVLSVVIAMLLGGGVTEFDIAESFKALGIYILGMLASFEVGYFISLLYVRYTWIPATIATIIYTAILFFAITEQINELRDPWVWYRILSVVILVIVTPLGSHKMMTTLPMRRSG